MTANEKITSSGAEPVEQATTGDHLPRGDCRGVARGDAPRSEDPDHGRGHWRVRRPVQDVPGSLRGVRRGARPRYADRGDRLRRRGAGPRADRLPTHRRDHVRRFSRRLLRPDRQQHRQAPLHVGRTRQDADRHPGAWRSGPAVRFPALADGRVLAPVGAGAQDYLPLQSRTGLSDAEGCDSRRQSGSCPRAQGAALDEGTGADRCR